MSITPTADLLKESDKLHNYFENELSNEEVETLNLLLEIERELTLREEI
jgi:hypothetical protein